MNILHQKVSGVAIWSKQAWFNYIYDVDLWLQGHSDNLKSLSSGKHCVKYEYPPSKSKWSCHLKQNRLDLIIYMTLSLDSNVIQAIWNLCTQANIVPNMNTLHQKVRGVAIWSRTGFLFIYMTLTFDSKVIQTIWNLCPHANIVSNMNTLHQKVRGVAIWSRTGFLCIYMTLTIHSNVIQAIWNLCHQANIVSNMNILHQNVRGVGIWSRTGFIYLYV